MEADPIDAAADMAEFLLGQKLKERKPVPESTGKCLNCDDPLAPGAKFCSFGCAQDWEKRQQAKARDGK